MREDFLDWIGGEVAFSFWAAGVISIRVLRAADEDGLVGTLHPVNILRRMYCCLDVRAIEVGAGAIGCIDELSWEAEDVPEERALLDYFVDIEARVYF